MFFYIFVAVFLLKVTPMSLIEFKLSDSKVLLPRTSFLAINYTLKGSTNVCHDWYSGTPEVVAITPIFDESSTYKCSHQAIITSVWQSNNRATATIYAKNIASGHIVKCDVIIDNIHSVKIETRTLELYLHETPQALIAKAFDENGNTFSTLDGIPFEWSIHAAGLSSDGQNVLRFITWTESEYITPVLIGSLEQQGLQGYMQLVSGLKTGAAKISLVFRDDKLKMSVSGPEVRLLVMANAALSPPLAYAIPYTTISYKVLVHSQGSSKEITMPDSQYYLKVSNTSLAELDAKGSTVTAKKIGQTEVTLIDKNINEDFRHPSSILYIVEQGYLTFHISPGDNQWILQSGRDNIYVITVRPFDFNSHAIFISDNMRLETYIPVEYFEILFSSKNGTYNVVKAIKEGHTILKSNFSFIVLQNGTKWKLDSPIFGTQELTIFPPIIVTPHSIIIPWYPNEKSVPGYLFRATGGSGEYKWMVTESILLENDDRKTKNCSVSVDSLGYIKPLKLGKSYIIAADQRNLVNRGISILTVDTIHSISFLLKEVEVEINNELNLFLKAVNHKNETISHCHWLPFEFFVGDDSKIEIIEVISSYNSTLSEACAIIKTRGLAPGFSKFTVSLFNLLTTKSNKDLLTTSITIGAFRPTRFIDQHDGVSTIGVFSMELLHIIDGPLPWTLDPSKYFYEFKQTVQSKKVIKQISLDKAELNSIFSGLLLKVQCIEVAEVDIVIIIGNKPSVKNPYPVTSEGSIRLSCVLPVYMKLLPVLIAKNESLNCPSENNTAVDRRVIINNKQPLFVEVVFSDRNGYQLDRSESFNIDIDIKGLINTQRITDIVSEVRPKVIYIQSDKKTQLLSTRSYFYVTPNESGLNIGDIQVKATSNSYRIGNGPKFHLESILNIRISKSMVVEPDKLILYQLEKITGNIIVKHGSGHFVVSPINSDFLKVNLMPKSDGSEGYVYEVVQMKTNKSQRNGVILIRDTCFASIGSESENVISIPVELVRPVKLQLLSINKMQLGSQINVLVQVFDDTNNIFPSEYLHMLNVELVLMDNTNIISTNSFKSKDWIVSPYAKSKSYGLIFKITGEKVGFTSFSVILKMNTDVVSNVQKIEVFPPLKLTPKRSVLLEGTEMQLSSTGGPHCCHEMIHYSIIKNTTLRTKEAAIEFLKGPNGLIKGVRHGSYAVTVRIEITDLDPSNGNQQTVLSMDEGLVGVVQIKSMTIHSPTKKLVAGNSLPLWISFSSSSNDLEHLPITGISLAGYHKNLMTFKWHLNPPQGVITNLENFLEPAGIHMDNRHLHSGLRLNSLNSGFQKIEVTVSGLPHNWLSSEVNKYEPLVSKLNIAIISKLDILEPLISVRTLLLPPSTKITLKSTIDNEAAVTYSLIHYERSKMTTSLKSHIRSGNILETCSHLASNDEEQFVLHILSSQSIKINAANEVVGNQSIALFVTVKHPTYSMLNPFIYQDSIFQKFTISKNAKYNSDITSLPLGGPFLFRITNHDELGNLFDVSPDVNFISYHLHRSDNLAISIATEDQLKMSSSQDTLQTSHKTLLKMIDANLISSQKLLQLQGLTSGDNILQLFYRDEYSEYTQLTDIVSIPTAAVLHCKNYQKNTCIEGLKVKYTAPFENGFWYSSDPDTVEIDSLSGEAILKKHGTSNIFYGLSHAQNVQGQHNKNVLISNELTVVPASRLTMKLVEGFLPYSNDQCLNNRCIPLNFDFQSNTLLAAIYVYSPSIMYEEIEDNTKFDKSAIENVSEIIPDVPMQCDVGFNFGENSVFRQDIFSLLINVELYPILAEYDSRLGIRQWACYVTTKPLDSISKDDLISVLMSLKYDLTIQLRARLRFNDVKSEFISVPVMLGYVLMLNENQMTLNVKASGEVLTDIKILLAPATKRILDENRKVVLSVVSNKPNLLEVLAPRPSSMDSAIWVYPLKAIVVNKETIDQVEIIISFPLTKQIDRILVNINIGKSISDKQTVDGGSKGSNFAKLNWISPVLCVSITAIIAVMVVMLVNNFIKPTIDEDLLTSPMKQKITPLCTPKTTHVWNSLNKDTSPNFQRNQYNPRYSFNVSRN